MTNDGLKSTIRIQGKCTDLTAEEIHKEIIERNKLENFQKKDYDYKIFDPLPMITPRLINNEEKKKYLMLKKMSENNNIKDINNIDKDKNSKEKKDINDTLKQEKYFAFKKNNKNKKTKKKYKNKKKGIYRVEISNIDKNVDEKVIRELFEEFYCKNLNFYKQPNGISNGYMDFLREKDADNCIKKCNKMLFGNRYIKLNKISFS